MQLIKRPQKYTYDELWIPRGSKFEYPETCPCCGAPGKEVEDSWYHKFKYECGGEWEWKSQIQNHTDKVYGRCGLDAKYAEQERVVKLAIFYASFCNWNMFPEGINSVKEHVLYKMKEKWSASSDYKESYMKWVDENFDKYIDIVKDICSYHRHVDPRLIYGFDENNEPIYETDWEEIAKRLDEIGFNEYGKLQFYKSKIGTSYLKKWWKSEN